MNPIKKKLDDIIDLAYGGINNRDNYKRYYIEFIPQRLQSKTGDYNPEKHHIRVFTANYSDTQIIVSALHELAHHIDFIRHKETGHQFTFYEEYRRLLYAAMDMRVVMKRDVLNDLRRQSNPKKLIQIVEEYIPSHDVSYKHDQRQIVVHNAFSIKDQLKEHGYKYNAITKNWEKEYDEKDHEEEIAFISALTDNFETAVAAALTFQKFTPSSSLE